MVGEKFEVDGKYRHELGPSQESVSIEASEWRETRVRGLARNFDFVPILTARSNRPSAFSALPP